MNTKTLHSPFLISSRLMPGIKIGEATISMEIKGYSNEGRAIYSYFIDLGGKEYASHDLESGCQGGTLQEGFESLLSFLGAAAESYQYNGLEMGDEDCNSNLFPEWVTEWAYGESDELSMLWIELEETPGLIS